ncbi:nitric oxide synthase oxygenase [Jeotgalibacillus aurantiacus]|uniref:nitric oxide synthase oxygenase n=1 Tax=Jeotgalibacillus aurantiacus TaxID=2763266 RepID=UPI001D09FA7D|nr:nitric oxide synthase oxygenase [Jeotgalibacillus aurantiacus]
MNDLFNKAESFIKQYYREKKLPDSARKKRLNEIKESIMSSGTYEQTYDEIEFGAKVAWRNSNRCIGRLFWNSLNVFDAREAASVEDVKQALFNHIDYATNDGKIRSTVTLFKPRRADGSDPLRIYNHQLIRYAGYKQEDGSIIGDPHSVELTEFCKNLGWEGKGTPYDVLPIVIQLDGESPVYFEVPSHLIKEVPIMHPESDAFNKLDLRWYAVPIISEMKLEIGGIEYVTAPFNGWYMETEIAARNFADEDRYNQLTQVAGAFGLSTVYQSSMWKDRAIIELCTAVMYSFKKAGVSIVDHHTASQQFARFEERENEEGREVTGDWTWLIPPVSPASTPIFHKQYNNTWKSPNFFYQPSVMDTAAKSGCPFFQSIKK